MAVPKGKVSKQRKHTRRSSHWKLGVPGISECPQCHKMKQNHRVCLACGYYDGKKVIEVEEN